LLPHYAGSRSHCTLAVTEALPFSVNVQVFVLLPPPLNLRAP
jgi:hypothetical protein